MCATCTLLRPLAKQSRVRGPGDALFSRTEPTEYGRDIPRKKRGDGRIVDRLNDTSTVDTRPPDVLRLHAPAWVCDRVRRACRRHRAAYCVVPVVPARYKKSQGRRRRVNRFTSHRCSLSHTFDSPLRSDTLVHCRDA